MTADLVQHARNAFDFLEKLYFETSCLIKEVEGILRQEQEEFVILRPGGYAITTRTSKGLEARDVGHWLLADGIVFFCPKEKAGKKQTKFCDDLLVLFLRVELRPAKERPPKAVIGYVEDIQLSEAKREGFTYFEKGAWIFAQSWDRIRSGRSAGVIDYKDSYWSFHGEFVETDLFTISGTDDIMSKLLNPILQKLRARIERTYE